MPFFFIVCLSFFRAIEQLNMESLLSPPKRSIVDPSVPLSATYFSSANYHGGFHSPKRTSFQERKDYDYPAGYPSSTTVPTMFYRNSLNDRVNMVSSLDQTTSNNDINDSVANVIASSFQDTK
jgi:hypothetical protein